MIYMRGLLCFVCQLLATVDCCAGDQRGRGDCIVECYEKRNRPLSRDTWVYCLTVYTWYLLFSLGILGDYNL